MHRNCVNPDIGTRLSRYELDLLDADERTEFEVHLLECEACFEELSQGKRILPVLRDLMRPESAPSRPDRDGPRGGSPIDPKGP